jgi:DNA-binding response OmpR family regulator
MRRQKALVIHDDPQIVDELSEIFASLGHEQETARSQEQARALLEANTYTYILLDLEIPARSESGRPRNRNGMNLLEELRADERLASVPIIVMVKGSMTSTRLVVWVMQRGAQDFIEKPLPADGYTLDRAIKKTLARWHDPRQQAPAPKPTPLSEQTRFTGGEMVFYRDRVELCGVRIISDTGTGQSLLMLQVLREKRPDGRFKSFSAEALARKIEADGVGTITGCAATIRKNITERMRKQVNILCGERDVLDNDGQGYHLRPWITVRVVEDEPSRPARVRENVARAGTPVLAGDP